MKVLVTGGTGFLGQKLALRLKNMGFEVTIVGRNKEIGANLENSGIKFILADLVDTQTIIKACQNKDYVFHSGALSSPWGKYMDFYNANVTGTMNIIEGCKEHNVKRLIHVSTPSIYFAYEDKFDIKEDIILPKNFVNAYADTKYIAEQKIDIAHKEGLEVITIRPRALFGPGDNAILPRLIKANQKGFVPVIGDKKVLVDITYIENVVDSLLLCMESPSHTLGKKYNITNGEPVYLTDILTKVFNKLEQNFKSKNISFKTAYNLASVMEFIHRNLIVNKEPVLTRYTVGVLSKSQTLDITAAKTDLGYNPKISIDEGIDLFIEWWRNEGYGN